MTEVHGLSYDAVPYPNLSHYSTHPDHMATLAMLSGLKPAPIEHCRVLELGCAGGGNLIPLAYCLPKSQFTGVDLSGIQVAEGQEKIKLLGLKNIRLEKRDILDVTPEMGKFDYLIAHGIYSWVPPLVREKMLEICRLNLAENGVAFISYNTYPGWYMIAIARDIMRFHTRNIEDPQERVTQARAMLKFFAEAHKEEADGYYGFLKLYVNYLEGNQEDKTAKNDSALLHDELEEVNQPLYFYQFVEKAEAHDLQYLADMRQMNTEDLKPEALEALRKNSRSLVELEQSLDFLQDRTFRQTMLCHKDVAVNRKVTPMMIDRFYLASQARPTTQEVDIHSVSIVQFKATNGAILTTDHPLTKAAMLCLADAWPQYLSFKELTQAAWERLKKIGGGEPKELAALEPQILATNLFKAFGYSSTLVELHSYRPPLETRVTEKPMVSQVARLQALYPNDTITNLRHERVTLEEFDRFLLPYLDGKHTLDALVSILFAGPVADGTLKLEREGEPVSEDEKRKILLDELVYRLKWLAQASLFVDAGRLGEELHGRRKHH